MINHPKSHLGTKYRWKVFSELKIVIEHVLCCFSIIFGLILDKFILTQEETVREQQRKDMKEKRRDMKEKRRNLGKRKKGWGREKKKIRRGQWWRVEENK